MFRGFTTINYFVDDVRKAAEWYQQVLDVEPYFVRPTADDPMYVEFRVGDSDDELGLLDGRFRPAGYSDAERAGAVMHWHVDDVREAYERLLSLGAESLAAPRDLEAPGWVIATVADPFGNVIGLMHSPHYVEQLGDMSAQN
ncbi:VOC family protein [Nocardioides antri]|uniref:VOC family protein n=1 Tax=Nocardioides antri TaxID=2607659 RepID=A0A5B1LZX2_9ACTN|nr:VOC family protein [Nocardioides antri]KAA1426212.1 VOC family protein [Nocardioides antri]